MAGAGTGSIERGEGWRSWLRRLAICALLAVLFAAPPAVAAPSDGIAPLTEAVEDALAGKAPEKAEMLARAGLELAETAAGAESLEAANLSRLLGDSLFNQQRYDEAEPLYRRALDIREAKLGDTSLETVISANDLAIVLKRLEKYPESETLYRRVVAMRTAIQGPNDPATARASYFLADIVDKQGRYTEAAGLMAEAIEGATVAYGPRDPTTVEWMGLRAAMLHDGGALDDAEAAYLEANALGAEVFEPADTRLAYTRQSLANLYRNAGRAAEAVPLYRLALAGRETSLGADDAATMNSVEGLARALWAIGETGESEAMFQRLLAFREANNGPDSAGVADALRWIGRAAAAQNRKADAEITFKRALAISEATLGPSNELTAFDLIALGQLYSGQQRFDEAQPLLQRGVAILEAGEGTRDSAAAARMGLSFLVLAAGDAPAAIALAQHSLEDTVDLYGAQSREAADILLTLGGYHLEANNLGAAEQNTAAALDIYRTADPTGRALLRAQSTLGRIRQDQGRLDEALGLHREVFAALAARYGEESTEVQPALANIASTLLDLGDAAGAADAFARSAAIVTRLAAIDSATAFGARTGAIEDQAIARALVFDGLVKAQFRAGPQNAEAAFLAAQRVIESQAAGALAQVAARQASGNGDLAALVRERQDLVAQWQADDAALTAALGAGATPTDTGALRAALADTDTRIGAIDATLNTGFPAFAELQNPAPLSLAEVRSRLGENDVLLFYADTGRLGGTGAETYLWVVPKTGAATWLRLEREPGELAAAVRAFREAMGVGANTRGPTALAKSAAEGRTDRVLVAAHELYAALLADVAPLIESKSLVVVPSRSLSALPFHAMVSALPASTSSDRFRDARWVARDHAITVLPSVTALQMANSIPRTDGSAYLAFANPLLTGRSGNDLRALGRTSCAPSTPVVVAEADAPALPSPSALFRGAEADVAAVRALPPLPETADEVCAIAASLGAGREALYLGEAATEANVKSASADGSLSRARTVHFATHGLVAGELGGLAEPAIVLTPPDAASAGDDGLLTASEVTTLKLDADWVILSACNTASSDGGGEALSGLARAFFYAGARALLVSHWPVNSDAAVRLTTDAIAEGEREPGLSKAEAMRRAMVAEIARGGVAADPMSWAPFIVVGI